MIDFSDVETAQKLETGLRKAHLRASTDGSVIHNIYLYDDVGHGFMNDSPAPFDSFEVRKESMGFPVYNPVRADLAWGRLLDFLNSNLKPTGLASEL